MGPLSISKWQEGLSQRRDEGASDEELADGWLVAAAMLPDPSPEWNLAHHQINAAAHDLGIGETTRAFWRHPTTLGQFHRNPGVREQNGVHWAQEYYQGCALVCEVWGGPGNWEYRVHTVRPDFTETPNSHGSGFATIAEAYAAGMSSQIEMLDRQS